LRRAGGTVVSPRPDWWRLDVRAPFRLGPRELPGRIWTASGCFGYGLDAHDIAAEGFGSAYAGVGMVVTKTVTPEPRTGNPQPRLCELPTGALNSIGLENVGLAAFLAEKLPCLAARGVPFVVSLAGTAPRDFGVMCAARAAAARDFPGWHGVELNVSCPNVAHGGSDFGVDPATVEECTARARPHLPDRVLLTKLTPNVARMAPLAEAARRGGADGVTAINSLIGLEVDLRSGRPVLPRRFGGYTGPGVLPVALAKVDEIVRETGIPVVAVGGIASADDALKFFALGAVAIQIGTAQLRDPFAAAGVAARLAPANG
jgi:dihydroorotate dehydrogenase (NAD+) catalytic subunit